MHWRCFDAALAGAEGTDQVTDPAFFSNEHSSLSALLSALVWHCCAVTAEASGFESSLLKMQGLDAPLVMPYAGRRPSAATATGFGEVHAFEQAELIQHALDLDYAGVS